MIKADAYGLGAVPVARALSALDPYAFGVATLDEAAELRSAGLERRLLIFTPLLVPDFARARALGVTPTLSSAEGIERWGAMGGGAWHLAIDTGMHRAGVEWWRVAELVPAIAKHPPEGAFTHFHSADEEGDSIAVQQERFAAAVATLPSRPRYLHAENSPGIERQCPSPWDLVRPGVFLYGVGGGAGSMLVPEPVAHLRARVVELHTVRAGESVSYGATWRAGETDRRVATLAIGYADGYRRHFSGLGQAIIGNRLLPVVGRVTMDMTMVDVTDAACEPGDVATLLGRDGALHLDINRVAGDAGLLTYELLVGLALRVPRRYLD